LPEIVYVILRYVFLALLFVFVLLVAGVVYREISPAPSTKREKVPKRARSRGRKATLALATASGKRKPAVWELEKEVIVGRGGNCDIPIGDEFASNLHAKIYEVEGRFYVEDLGSTNGTYVNGRRITYPTELRGGDQIKIGRTAMEFRR
jgi:hypothetical protein